MRPTYRVRDWDQHYEVAQTRKVHGGLNWVAMPTKHDGKGYRRLMRRPDGPAVFAAWVLIVQIAAKCPTRGVLADSDGPLNAEDLADKTGCPAEVFENALNVLSEKSIGWVERSEVGAQWEANGSGVGPQYPTLHNKQTNKPHEACAAGDESGSTLPPAPQIQGGWSVLITSWNLRDPVTVGVLYEEAKRKGWINGSEATKRGFEAAAEQAAAKGRQAGKLFTHLVKSKAWERPSSKGGITQASEAKAAERRRSRDGPPPDAPLPKLAEVPP